MWSSIISCTATNSFIQWKFWNLYMFQCINIDIPCYNDREKIMIIIKSCLIKLFLFHQPNLSTLWLYWRRFAFISSWISMVVRLYIQFIICCESAVYSSVNFPKEKREFCYGGGKYRWHDKCPFNANQN